MPPHVAGLLNSMSSADPAKRPDMSTALLLLGETSLFVSKTE
jgi:hypothetical protein